MANDRMMLKCAECEDSIVIARDQVGDGWSPSRDRPGEDMREVIAAFVAEHYLCGRAWAPDVIRLEFESGGGSDQVQRAIADERRRCMEIAETGERAWREVAEQIGDQGAATLAWGKSDACGKIARLIGEGL